MKLSPELEAKVLALAGVTPESAPKRGRAEPVSHFHTIGTAVWVIRGIEVPSLANSRDWRTRNRVAQAHRRAVSFSLGGSLFDLAPLASRYHFGGKVLVKLTRLGGRALDRTANLPASLKYIEDAVALMMGADDGDSSRWLCECAQEPGGATGVRIEITEG